MRAFSKIRRCISLAAEDSLFCLGDSVFRRVRGWPMGGSFSEPATLIDLGESVFRLYSDCGRIAARVGWHAPNGDVSHAIAGIQHVDDAVIASTIYCERCLLRGVQRLWPSDVGVSLEESGPRVRFLHVVLDIGPDLCVQVSPASPNADFAAGLSPYPAVSRLGPFLGFAVHDQRTLRAFVWGRVVAFHYAASGQPERGKSACIDLCAELLLLGWPQPWLGHAL